MCVCVCVCVCVHVCVCLLVRKTWVEDFLCAYFVPVLKCSIHINTLCCHLPEALWPGKKEWHRSHRWCHPLQGWCPEVINVTLRFHHLQSVTACVYSIRTLNALMVAITLGSALSSDLTDRLTSGVSHRGVEIMELAPLVLTLTVWARANMRSSPSSLIKAGMDLYWVHVTQCESHPDVWLTGVFGTAHPRYRPPTAQGGCKITVVGHQLITAT